MALENASPTLYERTKEREILPEEEDDDVVDDIDDREVFDILANLCLTQRALENAHLFVPK